MNGCSSKNPLAVTLGKKDVACFFDALEHFTVCSATNPLCRQQSGALALAVLNQFTRLFKPVTAKVRFWPDAVSEILKEGVNVGVAEFSSQKFPSKKRRGADDEIHFRPVGGQGVGAEEICTHGCENRLVREIKAVGVQPLNVTNPHDGLGKVMGVGVNLNVIKLAWADLRELRRESVIAQKMVHVPFQIEKFLQGDKEEIAGTAGGVKHADGFDAFKKGEDKFLRRGAGFFYGLGGLCCSGGRAFSCPLTLALSPRRAGTYWLEAGGGEGKRRFDIQEFFRLGANVRPFAAQWREDDGVNDGFNVRPSGKVCALLGAFGGIKAAFKEGAGNGHIPRSPICAGHVTDGGDFIGGKFKHGSGVEQAAVEMGDAFILEIAAGGHGAEQVGD